MPEQSTLTCPECAKSFYRKPAEVARAKGPLYCSRECRANALRQAPKEETLAPIDESVCPQGGACAYERHKEEVDALTKDWPESNTFVLHHFSEKIIRQMLDADPNETQCPGCGQVFVPKRRGAHCPDCRDDDRSTDHTPPSPQPTEIVVMKYRNASL